MRGKMFTAVTCAICAAGILMTGCGGGKKADDTIKIGMIAEMTGNSASYGNSIAAGTRMAVEEINAGKGLLGKKIQLIEADNKSEPAESANAMSKLINQDKVPLVVGAFTSSCAIAAANVSDVVKIPFVSSGATNPVVTLTKDGKTKQYTFRVCFIDPFQGTVGANFVADELKAKKAAIMIDNSSDYSKGLSKFFKESFTGKGGEIISEEAYLQKDTDFKAVLTKIRATNPDVIFLPGYYEEVGKIIKQARELGINVPFVGGDGWDSPKLAEIAGAEALNNTFFTNHYSHEATNPESVAFVAAYEKKFKAKPDALNVLGYDGLKLMADAVERAGSIEGDKVAKALAETKGFKAVTGALDINETHDAIKSAVIIEFKDGKQTYRSTVNP